jgi:hypothetical protein
MPDKTASALGGPQLQQKHASEVLEVRHSGLSKSGIARRVDISSFSQRCRKQTINRKRVVFPC